MHGVSRSYVKTENYLGGEREEPHSDYCHIFEYHADTQLQDFLRQGSPPPGHKLDSRH
jgi:hypothetical protein